MHVREGWMGDRSHRLGTGEHLTAATTPSSPVAKPTRVASPDDAPRLHVNIVAVCGVRDGEERRLILAQVRLSARL